MAVACLSMVVDQTDITYFLSKITVGAVVTCRTGVDFCFCLLLLLLGSKLMHMPGCYGIPVHYPDSRRVWFVMRGWLNL